jgi:hypothetical protein
VHFDRIAGLQPGHHPAQGGAGRLAVQDVDAGAPLPRTAGGNGPLHHQPEAGEHIAAGQLARLENR